MNSSVKIIECPRDAMQGWPTIIPTTKKVAYINLLLKAGFDTIDFGSFVSAKAIPQMADTADVLSGLNTSSSKLLAIIANERGASEAAGYSSIQYLGFPFSISETFQQRNTNSSILQSFDRLRAIQDICLLNQKELVVYISMGFGNPYGDAYDTAIVLEWIDKIKKTGVTIISMADTVGIASPELVHKAMLDVILYNSDIEIGAHLHATSHSREAKLEAAYSAGCRRFDGAVKGIGGCPMAGDVLVGNIDTEFMVHYFESKNTATQVNVNALQHAVQFSSLVFI